MIIWNNEVHNKKKFDFWSVEVSSFDAWPYYITYRGGPNESLVICKL